MRSVIAALCALVVAGCASGGTGSSPLIDHLSDGRVKGDADQVSVAGGRVDALPLAVFHCARYHRAAQFARTEGARSVFNCVRSGS